MEACETDDPTVDVDLDRLAVAELLRDAQRASDRAATFGATAWQRNPVPKHNRTFLNRALAGALTQNAWLAAKATKAPKPHPPAAAPGGHFSTLDAEVTLDGLRLDDRSEPSSSRGVDPFRRPSEVGLRSPRKGHDGKFSPMKSPKRCGEKFSPRREGSCGRLGKRERSSEGRRGGAELQTRKRTCARH
ncbi:uncharacterized protein LOC129582290 [Paramacrobiotus metropolitanus]|uniref:uncharacterized protein LOC129582290 n=1 Tax=Paramacrobiotus metropolitanus TaxID=2943436 RepID=UPI00244624AE|nr:uncharacterized protein LOC129582290 [Paramacrobiotus metropolitanus]XP_055329759.1 uncharacterized protein LOC129582290 [Paramacrobiotus metropolitanus]